MMLAIEKILGVLAAVIISTAQVIYLGNTIRRKIRPSVLSWVGWSFLMGTSVLSQVLAKGWQWSMTSVLSSAVGCLTIGLVALFCGILKRFLPGRFPFRFGGPEFGLYAQSCGLGIAL